MTTEITTVESSQFSAGMTLGQLSKVISNSGCFGQCNPNIVAVKLLAGKEIGLGPIEAMRGLHVFDGKIELGAAAMSSKIKNSGVYDYEVKELDANGCVLRCWEQSPRTGEWRKLPEISFTREEAKTAGLLGKKNWVSWFEDMAFARCMSRFFRRYCPHLAAGAVYAPGEVSDDLQPEPLNGDRSASRPRADASTSLEASTPPKPPRAAEEVAERPVDPPTGSSAAAELPSKTASADTTPPQTSPAREPEEGTPTDGHPPLEGDLGPDWVEKKGPDFFGSEDWEEVK